MERNDLIGLGLFILLVCGIMVGGGYVDYLKNKPVYIKEYQMDVTMTGYTIFDEDGHTIGVIPYGECPVLDEIIDNDNL